jgi:hypothetical protein
MKASHLGPLLLIAFFGMLYQISQPGPLFPPRPIQHPAGFIVAPDEPEQKNLPDKQRIAGVPQYYRDHQMDLLARYQFEARIISMAWFRKTDPVSFGKVSPMDLGVGWGRMSDSANIDALEWSHSTRFLSFKYANGLPLPLDEIIRSIANVHVLPANDDVLEKLEGLRPGQKVRVTGYLVELKGNSRFRSSLTREDRGAGACEMMWVESVLGL